MTENKSELGSQSGPAKPVGVDEAIAEYDELFGRSTANILPDPLTTLPAKAQRVLLSLLMGDDCDCESHTTTEDSSQEINGPSQSK